MFVGLLALLGVQLTSVTSRKDTFAGMLSKSQKMMSSSAPRCFYLPAMVVKGFVAGM